MSERFLDFASGAIKVVALSEKNNIGRHIGGQLLRSATSCGANYEEACGAESRQDFVHKLQIVLKELRESLYWLKLLERATVVPESALIIVMREAQELSAIIGESIVTVKEKQKTS